MRTPLLAVLVATVAIAAFPVCRARRSDPLLELSGAVEAQDVEAGSLVGGRVKTIHTEEGAQVAPGQLLVTLEPDLVDLQIAEQRARVAEAEAGMARSERGPRTEAIARARAEADNAARERRRAEALAAQGIAAGRDLDAAATRSRVAAEALAELERGSTFEDLSAAASAAERERARLGYLERQRQETEVRSPVGGIVEVFDLRPGDLVAAGQPVARILEPGQVWVRVYVPEPELGRVRVGQNAAVRVDTFPEKDFPGRVVEIRDRAEYTPRNVQTRAQRSDQVFGVKVAIDPAPELKPGMAATVTLR